jgi:polysaccharide biosynthesis protein PslH
MITNQTILSISPFIHKPFLHGTITRIYNINKELASHNHLLTVYREDQMRVPPEFATVSIGNPSARLGQLFSPKLLIHVMKTAKNYPPDLILAHHLWAGVHSLLCSRLLKVPFILDNHNVEFVRFQRMNSPLWTGVWLLERLICSMADSVQCVSEVDRAILISSFALPPDRVHVVENGVNVSAYANCTVDTVAFSRSLGLKPTDRLILFYGSLTYQPNLDAAKMLIEEIAPRLAQMGVQGQVLIIGHGNPPITSMNVSDSLTVHHLGFVEDLLSYLKSADVVAVPLLAGSGTRFKILESIASRRPVVTTTIGAEGLDLDACAPFLTVHDQWDDFASALATVENPASAQLSPAFLEKYDWSKIVGRMQFPHAG